MLILTVFVVGMAMSTVSAVKFKDYCHGGTKKHKATWTKKYAGTSYVGTIYKNGHKYKKYVRLYEWTCICKQNKYHKAWLKAHKGCRYYSYQTFGVFKNPNYVYKRVY